MKRTIAYLLFQLFLYACSPNEEAKKKEIRSAGKPSNATLIIIDSLKVPLDSIEIDDYDFSLIQDSILFLIDHQQQLWTWNLQTNAMQMFSQKGEAPGEYIRPVAISALNKDSIFIIDRMLYRVSLFDINGKIKGSWNIYQSDKSHEPVVFYNFSRVYREKGKDIILEYVSRHKKYDMESPKYYENTKVLTSFNLMTNEHHYFISYEKDSPYRQNQFFISPFDPHIDFNGNYYSVVFPHDFRIYIYTANDKILSKTITNIPYKFPPTPEGVPFDKAKINFSRDYVKYNIKKNALNTNALFMKQNPLLLIRQYICPLSNVLIPDDMNYWRTNYIKQDRYLQIVNIENEQVVEEAIEIPEILGKMIYAENEDKIIFNTNSKIGEENVLYITKIVQNGK